LEETKKWWHRKAVRSYGLTQVPIKKGRFAMKRPFSFRIVNSA
jgi:hypothetical protein